MKRYMLLLLVFGCQRPQPADRAMLADSEPPTVHAGVWTTQPYGVDLIITGDVNADGVVNNLDVLRVRGCFGQYPLRGGPCQWSDANGDYRVDNLDVLVVRSHLGNLR